MRRECQLHSDNCCVFTDISECVAQCCNDTSCWINTPDCRAAPALHLHPNSLVCRLHPFVPHQTPSKYTPAHDAVAAAAALLHKHRLIFCSSVGLILMKSRDFNLGSRSRESANNRLALNHSDIVACIRSDTRHRSDSCHRGGVVNSQAYVRGIPGSTLEIKISRFHHNHESLWTGCACGEKASRCSPGVKR